MAKVTGIGGVFYKVADPAVTRAWYAEHLGIAADDYGASLPAEGQGDLVAVQGRQRLLRGPAFHGQSQGR